MPDPTTALYVRLPHQEFDKLDRAADALATNKKAIVTTLVSRYVDPDSAHGLDDLRTTLAATPRRVTIDLGGDATTIGHHAFTPAPPHDVLTPVQAAELLQIPEAEVLELAEADALPARRVGAHWRFSRPALVDWLAGEHGKRRR